MKGLLLSALLTTAISTTATAQDSLEVNSNLHSWKGWTVNPYASIGMALSKSDKQNGLTFDPGITFSVGTLIGYHINSHLSFHSGFAFSTLEWQSKNDLKTSPFIYRTSSTNKQFSIPFIVKINTSKYDKIGFLVQTGPYINLNILENSSQIEQISPSATFNIKENISTVIFSYYLFMGLKIPMFKTTWIEIGLERNWFGNQLRYKYESNINTTSFRFGIATKIGQ
jgi:hypothetical protein